MSYFEINDSDSVLENETNAINYQTMLENIDNDNFLSFHASYKIQREINKFSKENVFLYIFMNAPDIIFFNFAFQEGCDFPSLFNQITIERQNRLLKNKIFSSMYLRENLSKNIKNINGKASNTKKTKI